MIPFLEMSKFLLNSNTNKYIVNLSVIDIFYCKIFQICANIKVNTLMDQKILILKII